MKHDNLGYVVQLWRRLGNGDSYLFILFQVSLHTGDFCRGKKIKKSGTEHRPCSTWPWTRNDIVMCPWLITAFMLSHWSSVFAEGYRLFVCLSIGFGQYNGRYRYHICFFGKHIRFGRCKVLNYIYLAYRLLGLFATLSSHESVYCINRCQRFREGLIAPFSICEHKFVGWTSLINRC